jgi:glycosyltransferase involved in cell wall biosynthesis
MRFSVVICAYNAAERLPKTLKHLSKLDYDSANWELIVVDNCSTDGSGDIVQTLWASFSSPVVISIVSEPKPGLSHARWAGVNAAQGEFIVFCDDDNWLNSDYLRVAEETLKKVGLRSVVGGASIPAFEEGVVAPSFFYTNAMRYAVGSQTNDFEDVTETKGYIYGAGMVIPKSAFVELKQVGFKQNLLGRTGKQLTSGEEVEFCLALVLTGWRIYSQPNLTFRHFIPKTRLTLEYLNSVNDLQKEADLVNNRYRYLCEFKFKGPGGRWKLFAKSVIAFACHPNMENLEKAVFPILGNFFTYKYLPMHLIVSGETER